MINKRYGIADLFYKSLIVLLEILCVIVQIGFIVWLYFLMPTNRIAIVISYIMIAPAITWALKNVFRSANFVTLYFLSLLISSILLSLLIALLGHFKVIEFSSELLSYISTILFSILVYYVFGNQYRRKTDDIKTIKDSYAYSYLLISKDYGSYFIRTLIFVFYTFTLIFGQLRDLGIHNSSLFKYEQYAIILIIAIDRIINSLAKEFPRVKEHIKIRKDKEKEREREVIIQMFDNKLKEITKQFELLLKVNPEYDIEELDLWENVGDTEHPQTKLLHLYLLFHFFLKNNCAKTDELFICTGKSVKRSLNRNGQS